MQLNVYTTVLFCKALYQHSGWYKVNVPYDIVINEEERKLALLQQEVEELENQKQKVTACLFL